MGNNDELPRPIERSDMRLKFGILYFTMKRYAKWYLPGANFAKERVPQVDFDVQYPHVIAAHQSPLIRSLRKVDLWIQQNDSKRTYVLQLELSDTHLIGRWQSDSTEPYRYEVFEGGHHITEHGAGVYIRHNEIRRRIYDETGKEIDEEPIAQNHALMMYRPFIEAASR